MASKVSIRRVSDITAAVASLVALCGSSAAQGFAETPVTITDSACSSENSCFQLQAVSIEGATAYSPEELVQYYERYLTREISQSDLVQIAADITDRYREDGYFLSQATVPVQQPHTGVARIKVYEGYLDAVEVSGVASKAATPGLTDLVGMRPLRLSELDERLAIAQDTPGLKTEPRLTPDIDEPAKHKLTVETKLKRAEFAAYTDNRGPATAGPWQTYLTAAFNSVAKFGDRLSFAVLAVPDDLREFAYGEASYSAPLSERSRLRGYVGASKAKDGADPASRDVGGESWSTGLAYVHTLKRTRALNMWAQVSGDLRHVEHDWSDFGGYRDDLHVVRTAVGLRTAKQGTSTYLLGTLSAGERYRPDRDRSLSRFDADRAFWKANLHAARYQDLGRYLGLYVSADGQWSPNTLLASEELAFGGGAYGRGYNYGEISGDRGIAASAELRAGWDPKPEAIKFVQGYSFVDAGRVWNIGPRPYNASLVSAGTGVRVRMKNHLTIAFEAARPLTRTPYDKDKKNWRQYLSLSAAF